MSISAVTNQTLPADPTGDGSSRVPQKTLNQDDFLKLLVTQMTSQDPLNPQQDTQFIGQMAQFSALQESQSMQQDMAKMSQTQQILQANAMLGRSVVLQTDQDTQTSGIVSRVQIQAGAPLIFVNGQPYDLSTVLSISAAPGPTQH
jgi:flagellar basal-body rod modification protein FlgD